MIDGYSIKKEARSLTKYNFPGVTLIPLVSLILPVCIALIMFGRQGLALFAILDEATIDTIMYLSEVHAVGMYFFSSIFMTIFPQFMSYWEINYYLHISNNREVKVSAFEVFRKSNLKVFLMYFLKTFVAGLIISLWALLFIIPGIVKSFSYLLVPYLAIDRPELGVFETLRESQRIMHGNRFAAFNLLISFIFWYISIPLTAGLTGLYVQPYTGLTLVLLYNDLVYEHKYTSTYEQDLAMMQQQQQHPNGDVFDNVPKTSEEEKPFDLSIYNSQTLDDIESLDEDVDNHQDDGEDDPQDLENE